MTLESVLYTANAHTKGARENGTARTDDGRLDIKLSPAAVSLILTFTSKWKKWYRVLRHRKGFGLFDSVRFWPLPGARRTRSYAQPGTRR